MCCLRAQETQHRALTPFVDTQLLTYTGEPLAVHPLTMHTPQTSLPCPAL